MASGGGAPQWPPQRPGGAEMQVLVAPPGQQARELHVMQPMQQLPPAPPAQYVQWHPPFGSTAGWQMPNAAATPLLGSMMQEDANIRRRVVCISAFIAAYVVVGTLLQYTFDIAALEDAFEKVKHIAHIKHGSGLAAMILSSLPSIGMSITIGLLIPFCGYVGAKQNQPWLIGCFAGCNALHCCCSAMTMVLTGLFMTLAGSMSPAIQNYLIECDPILCAPGGFNVTDQEKIIDCLAAGEWEDYRPRFDGPRYPAPCPKLFLKCPNKDPVTQRPATEWLPRRLGAWSQANQDKIVWRDQQPTGQRRRRARKTDMQDAAGMWSQTVPGNVGFAGPLPTGPPVWESPGEPDDSDWNDGTRPDDDPPDAPPVEPADPLADCLVATKAADTFHEVRLVLPELMPKVLVFGLVKVLLSIPVVVLGCLGALWGKDLYTRLGQGYLNLGSQGAMPTQVPGGWEFRQPEAPLQTVQNFLAAPSGDFVRMAQPPLVYATVPAPQYAPPAQAAAPQQQPGAEGQPQQQQ